MLSLRVTLYGHTVCWSVCSVFILNSAFIICNVSGFNDFAMSYQGPRAFFKKGKKIVIKTAKGLWEKIRHLNCLIRKKRSKNTRQTRFIWTLNIFICISVFGCTVCVCHQQDIVKMLSVFLHLLMLCFSVTVSQWLWNYFSRENSWETRHKPFYFFHGQNLIEIIKSNAANNLLGFKVFFFLSPSLLISERKFNLWIWWNSLILNQTWFSILGVYYHYRRKKKGKSAVRDINGFLEHIKAQLLWGHDRVIYLFLSPNAALMFSEACLPLTQPSNYYLSASFHLAPTALPSLSPPRT